MGVSHNATRSKFSSPKVRCLESFRPPHSRSYTQCLTNTTTPNYPPPCALKVANSEKKTSCFVYPRPPWKVFTTFKVDCMFLLVENLRKAYDSQGERLVGHQWFTRYFVILNEELFGSPESSKITGWCLVMSKMSKTWPFPRFPTKFSQANEQLVGGWIGPWKTFVLPQVDPLDFRSRLDSFWMC